MTKAAVRSGTSFSRCMCQMAANASVIVLSSRLFTSDSSHLRHPTAPDCLHVSSHHASCDPSQAPPLSCCTTGQTSAAPSSHNNCCMCTEQREQKLREREGHNQTPATQHKAAQNRYCTTMEHSDREPYKRMAAKITTCTIPGHAKTPDVNGAAGAKQKKEEKLKPPLCRNAFSTNSARSYPFTEHLQKRQDP